MKHVRKGLYGLICLSFLVLMAGCGTTVEAQQSRFDRAIDSLDLVSTKQPHKEKDVTKKITEFKAARDKIMAGSGDKKVELARLAGRVESFTSKLSPTLPTTGTMPGVGTTGSKLAKPTTTLPPGQAGRTGVVPGAVGTPGMVPGRAGAGKLGAPGVTTGKLGVPGMGTGKLGAPGMGTGKLGAPGMRTGKLGAPGMGTGKLGAPGMANGKLGGPGMANGKLGRAPGLAKPMGAPGKLGAPGMAARPVGVYLMNAGPQKIRVIKAIRASTGLGLAQANAIASRPNSPVKVGLTMAQANALKAQLAAQGATVIIR